MIFQEHDITVILQLVRFMGRIGFYCMPYENNTCQREYYSALTGALGYKERLNNSF